jgi:Domain of unknown function (DUF4267)
VMKSFLGVAVVVFIAISLCVVGGSALMVPETAARLYGVATSDPTARAYVWATGLRDIAIGCWLLGLVAVRVNPRVLGVLVAVLTLIPVGDAIIVWTNARTASPLALACHLSSAVAFITLAWWLRRDCRSM